MQTETPIAGLAHAIQLAVAPVFLLSGIAALLNVLTSRLARIIDRARTLERGVPSPEAPAASGAPTMPAAPDAGAAHAELVVLRARTHLINRAIGLCTYSALLVAGVVAALFLGSFVRVGLSAAVAVAFVAAMLALIGGLVSFLREVHLSTRWLRQTFPTK